jgi:hypothetical protein
VETKLLQDYLLPFYDAITLMSRQYDSSILNVYPIFKALMEHSNKPLNSLNVIVNNHAQEMKRKRFNSTLIDFTVNPVAVKVVVIPCWVQ